MVDEKSVKKPLSPKNFKEWDFLVKKQESLISSLKLTLTKVNNRLEQEEEKLKILLENPILPPWEENTEEEAKTEQKQTTKEEKEEKVKEAYNIAKEQLEKKLEELKEKIKNMSEE